MSKIEDVKVEILFCEPSTARNLEPEYQLRLRDGGGKYLGSEIILATGKTGGAAVRKGKKALKRLMKELEKEVEDE